MLCSKCSEIVRPVVAFDIDGTMGDYHGHFLKFASTWLGVENDEHEYDYVGFSNFGGWFCDYFGVDRTVYRQIKLAYRQGGMKRSMPIYPMMVDVVRQIAKRAEIWVTTTRPYLRLDMVDPDTRFWLDRHSIPYQGLLYDEFKYSRFAENVDHERVVAIVDDLSEMYDEAAQIFGENVPILRRTRWNRSIDRRNVCTAGQISEVLEMRINSWEDNHERDSASRERSHAGGSLEGSS